MNKAIDMKLAAGDAGKQKKVGQMVYARVMEAEERVGVVRVSGYIGCGNATVEEFSRCLDELRGDGCTRLEVVVNSMGGNLFEASGIYDLLAGCGLEVVVKIYGVAASAATLIACGGGRVLISENSRFMVHRAKGWVEGTADEIEGYAADLRRAEEQVIGIYCKRTGKGAEEVKAILAAETWMSAEVAVAEGWCDGVISAGDEVMGDADVEPGDDDGDDVGGADVDVEPGDDDDDVGGDDVDVVGKGVVRNYTVLRRMMEVLGVKRVGASVDELEGEVKRLVEENERLAAENDGLRGMQGVQERVMRGREAEVEMRVKEGIVREMAAMGVSRRLLPGPCVGVGDGGSGMTNEKLRAMRAQDALGWIQSHPREAARLAGGM